MDDPRRTRPRFVPILISAMVIAGLWAAWRWQPVPQHIATSAAYRCRRDYAGARTAADTADVDTRIWRLSNVAWRRIPSCGELRAGGFIES